MVDNIVLQVCCGCQHMYSLNLEYCNKCGMEECDDMTYWVNPEYMTEELKEQLNELKNAPGFNSFTGNFIFNEEESNLRKQTVQHMKDFSKGKTQTEAFNAEGLFRSEYLKVLEVKYRKKSFVDTECGICQG